VEESYEIVDKPSCLKGSYEHEEKFVQTAAYRHVILDGGMLKKISWLHELNRHRVDLRYPALRF
jgi:hypothetical protein